MAKRTSISGAIKQAAQNAASPITPEPELRTVSAPKSYKASTREGKKMIAAPVDPAARQQLKMLAAELDRKAEDLIREALRDLFVKYGKAPIA